MLQELLKKKSKNKPSVAAKHIVALDIGTEYVKALVARIKGDEAEIIGVGRARQELSAMQSGAVADISSVVEACDKALTEAEQQARVDARDAVIGIAGELVKGSTITVKYTRKDREEPLTYNEVETIVSKAQAHVYENVRKRLAVESGNQHIDVRLVNSALVGIEIDGYNVANPIGFQGGNVAVQLYTAFAPMIHIGALERIAEELDLELVALAAEPFAVARSVLGNDATSNLSAVLIDVGGGTTDLAIIDEGGVEGTIMFGIGGRAFTRTIANDMSLDFKEAEEMKLSLNEGNLSEKNSEKVLSSIEKTLGVWLSGVELALEEFDRVESIPHQVYLCGGGASLSQIVSAMNEKDWYKSLPFAKKPKVQYVSPNQVVGIIDKTSAIQDHTYITAMGLVRVALDSLNEKTEDLTWKEKIDRILSV